MDELFGKSVSLCRQCVGSSLGGGASTMIDDRRFWIHVSFRFVSYPTSSTRHRAHKLHRLTNNPCGLQHAHYLCFESVLCTVHRERKWPHVLYAGDQRAMV